MVISDVIMKKRKHFWTGSAKLASHFLERKRDLYKLTAPVSMLLINKIDWHDTK